MSLVPIYIPGRRETKWNKVRARLEPRTSRSGVRDVNRARPHTPSQSPIFYHMPTFIRYILANCSPPRTVLSSKSHDKVDFHVFFSNINHYLLVLQQTRSLPLNSLSLSIVLFLFNPHPISYARIDLRKNRVFVRDCVD